MPSLSLNVGLNNGRKLPFGGGAAPSGLPTATTNIITLQSGGPGFPVPDGAQFPKASIGYFGPYGESDDYYALIWSGSRWELSDDGTFVLAYNTTSGQTTNYFPDQGNWFDYLNQPVPLIFVGS